MGATSIKEYIDDGYSGSNFDRPSWKQLICDIENKTIDTIITKDLSRMGRDYITMGSYIERIFPQNKIRYIAITDDIDTLYETPGLEYLQFKLIFNDLYSDLALNFIHDFPHPTLFVDRRIDYLMNYLKDKNGTTQAFRFKNKVLKMKELASNSLCFVSFNSYQIQN